MDNNIKPELEQTEGDPVIGKTNNLAKAFKGRIDACKNYRRKLIQNWSTNIDYRQGKPFASQSDQDRIYVNLDWSLTKSKQASLFSQTPQVRVTHHPDTQQAGPWLQSYERKLNDALMQAGVEAAMDECLPDCINAAGIGAVLVSHDAITEDVTVPAIDIGAMPPQLQAFIMQAGTLPNGDPIPTEVVPKIIDHRYKVTRISPADLLWPLGFNSSDFDNAPWLGRTGRITWAEAKRVFKLTDEDKQSVMGEERTSQDRLRNDVDKDKTYADDNVTFDEIWYKEHEYDPDAKSFNTLHHMVFVGGKPEPVIDTPWEGQKIDDESGQIVGAVKFPIRVLTLTYITDETIPPSDSAIGRSQVDEINRARTQIFLQREHSRPFRWGDINRIDPTVFQSVMRGTWQNIIPVQGNGQNIIGEVARAAYPPEDFTFDEIAKQDLNEEWSIGPNQAGIGKGVETAAEANSIQSNFQTRIGRERAKVAKFFVSIAEVMGGLLCLYEDTAEFGEGFTPLISRALNYSILADSTVLIDANQRLERLVNFINFAAKSGWVDVAPVLKEIATLSGLDPNVVIRPPQPKPPVEPNISLRLSGSEDLTNPLIYAMLLKSGQAPTSELIEQAKQAILQGLTPPPNAPQGPMAGAQPMMSPAPPPAPPKVGDAHPNWEAMSRINKRANDGGPQ